MSHEGAIAAAPAGHDVHRAGRAVTAVRGGYTRGDLRVQALEGDRAGLFVRPRGSPPE